MILGTGRVGQCRGRSLDLFVLPVRRPTGKKKVGDQTTFGNILTPYGG